MIKLPHYEEKALDAASDAAGAYLEEIGKTDLATMTADEWRHLLGLVYVTATDKVREQVETEAVPF